MSREESQTLLEYMLATRMASDERTARGLILSSRVLVDDRPVTSPSKKVDPQSSVRIRGNLGLEVSRGVLKLRPAIERTGFDVQDKICLDLGVSTGGFTQVLLERGASRVYAVDVGYGI